MGAIAPQTHWIRLLESGRGSAVSKNLFEHAGRHGGNTVAATHDGELTREASLAASQALSPAGGLAERDAGNEADTDPGRDHLHDALDRSQLHDDFKMDPGNPGGTIEHIANGRARLESDDGFADEVFPPERVWRFWG